MSTTYIHRLLVLCPAAKAAALAAWINANISVPGCTAVVDANLGPGLSANGNAGDTPTYYWCSLALIDADCRTVLAKLCQLASITPPTLATWNGWSQSQKIAWLQSVQAAIWSSYSVWVRLSDNRGQWDDPQAALAQVGVKVIAAAAPA